MSSSVVGSGHSNAMESTNMRFTYWEYQLLMLCLGGTMCMGLVAIELMMRRFQVLPLLFPGMFSIRERRLYFFDFDVDDVAIGKRLRAEAKLLVRIVLFVVLSYLWQHCVLETDQKFGLEFPREQCDKKMACFSSEIAVATFFSRAHERIDCSAAVRNDFEYRVVVSCIAFVQPSASKWLMHLGIAHSITQLNFKLYEFFVWLTGHSRLVRHVMCFLVLLTTLGVLGLFVIGYFTTFTSSWLEVVTAFYIPVFLNSVWRTGRILKSLWERDAHKVQGSIEQHLNEALEDFQDAGGGDHPSNALGGGEESAEPIAPEARRRGQSFLMQNPVAQGAKQIMKAVGVSKILEATYSQNGSSNSWSWGRRPSGSSREASADSRPPEAEAEATRAESGDLEQNQTPERRPGVERRESDAYRYPMTSI